jgi:hypothetical protein
MDEGKRRGEKSNRQRRKPAPQSTQRTMRSINPQYAHTMFGYIGCSHRFQQMILNIKRRPL